MLSPTDVHYLLGFLTYMSTPDDVEIILGDLVFDEGAREARDVDVTVKYKKPDGSISVFKGIEVKRHKRPLDVSHVEQLAAKLIDMPRISHRAIVSASGYTQSAIRKASAHGIELFQFGDWTNTMQGFDHIKFAPGIALTQQLFGWASIPNIEFQLNESDMNLPSALVSRDTPIFDSKGEPYPKCPNMVELTWNVLDRTIEAVRDHDRLEDFPSGVPASVKVTIHPNEEIYVIVDEKRAQVKSATVTGYLARHDENLSITFKVLKRIGEEIPYAGCAIGELSIGTLVALVVSQSDHSLKLFPLPLNSRNAEKVRMLKLK